MVKRLLAPDAICRLRQSRLRNAFAAVFLSSLLSVPHVAYGQSTTTPRDQAYKLFSVLNGVPPTAARLDEIESLLKAGELRSAALAAINDEDGNFFSIVLRRVAAKWTNVDKSPRIQLNDGIALTLGLVANDEDFRKILHADLLYVGNPDYPELPFPLIPYAPNNNDHFVAPTNQNNPQQISLEEAAARLKIPVHKLLIPKRQSELSTILPTAASGIITSRAGSAAYLNMGTNRRAVAVAAMDQFWCRPLKSLASTTRPHTFIAQDVPRDPGGDAGAFINNCAGCHAIQDGLRTAYAYHDYLPNTGIVYTPGQVVAKVTRNRQEFPEGRIATSDAWYANWGSEHNNIGWKGPDQGNGASSLNQAFANADQFGRCMAETALKAVCAPDIEDPETKNVIEQLAQRFRVDNHNLRNLFADAALTCTVK
jgi:hypothetical protein